MVEVNTIDNWDGHRNRHTGLHFLGEYQCKYNINMVIAPGARHLRGCGPAAACEVGAVRLNQWQG